LHRSGFFVWLEDRLCTGLRLSFLKMICHIPALVVIIFRTGSHSFFPLVWPLRQKALFPSPTVFGILDPIPGRFFLP